MTVHFIGAGPGAPDLLTLRAQSLIATSPVCLYAGSLVPEAILSHCPVDARKVNTASLDLDTIIDECRKANDIGHDVARLHSGDLSIWSAMGEQIRRLRRENIEISVTPGVPSFAAAAAVLGAELTLPGLSQSVVLTRMPGRASAVPDTEALKNFARTRGTLAIHLSIQNLELVVDTLVPFYGGDCQSAVVHRASWPDQKIFRGKLSEIVSLVPDDIERTAIILVGPVLLAAGFDESSLYSTYYDRRFRPSSTRRED